MIADKRDLLPCTCSSIRRASRYLTQVYDRYLAPVGLRISQYALLRELARMGPMTMQAVAREMGLDRTTLGRNLRPLERDGLVSIVVDQADRRGRRLGLTDGGRATLARALPLWEAAQSSFEATFGHDQAAHANDVLLQISENEAFAKHMPRA